MPDANGFSVWPTAGKTYCHACDGWFAAPQRKEHNGCQRFWKARVNSKGTPHGIDDAVRERKAGMAAHDEGMREAMQATSMGQSFPNLSELI